MSSFPSVSVGPVATAEPSEATRLLDILEQELGVQAQPGPATAGRRNFTIDAHDVFEARDLVAAALGNIHPGWQSLVDLGA